MGDQLKQLLEQKQAEASYSDSSAFSLDSYKARSRLARYQLPHSGLWLVKLVQAAVALEARRIRIRFKRRRIWLNFDPAQSIDGEQLLHEVLAGTLPEDDARLHLVTGLRACGASVSETLEWRSGGSRVKLGKLATTVEVCPERGFTLIATRPARRRGLRATLTSPVSHLARQTVEEYEALANHCWPCPIAIEVDGKPLRTGYDSPLARGLQTRLVEITVRSDNSRRSEVCACLGLRHLPPLPDRPALPVLRAGRQLEVARPLYCDGTFVTFPAPPEAGAVLCLEHHHGAPSQVDFVWDGAVVASEPLDWSDEHTHFWGWSIKSNSDLGVRCVFAVRRHELDLSQFAVRDQKALAARLSRAMLPELLEMLTLVREQVSHLTYVPYSHERRRFWSTALGMTLAGASVLAASPLPLVLVSVVAGINLVAVRKALRTSLDGLKESLSQVQPDCKPGPL